MIGVYVFFAYPSRVTSFWYVYSSEYLARFTALHIAMLKCMFPQKRSQCFIYCDPCICLLAALYIALYALAIAVMCVYPIDTKKRLELNLNAVCDVC